MVSVECSKKHLVRFIALLVLVMPNVDQFANAGTITPGVVYTQGGMPADHYGLDADYMWNCGGAETCAPTQGPNRAIFEQTFNVQKNLPYPQFFYGTGAVNPADPLNRFALSVMADDYFAVYVNRKLLGWSWLNDGASANAPNFSDEPSNWTMAELFPFLVDGKNVIDIFACNGRTSDNLDQGKVPGATAEAGFAGCTTPSSYGNNWLLVQGGFVQQDNAPGGHVNGAVRFVSGNGSDDNVHQTEFAVIPEPASIVLLLTGLVLGVGRSTKVWRSPRAAS